MQGTGPTAVFLHGVGGNRTNWSDQLTSLSDRYRCVAWDARGYGASDDPDRPVVFEDFTRDLEGLLDHLGASTAHLVGLSMGGFIAQCFFHEYPDRVATLTLAATSAGLGLLTNAQKEEFLAQRLRPLEGGKEIRDIAPGLVTVLAGSRATAEVRHRLLESLEALRVEPYKNALRAIVAATDFHLQLTEINVPTLIIVGSEDRVLPPAHSRYLAGRIPNSQLVLIEGAGHLCNLEAPIEFNTSLRAFFRDHPILSEPARSHRD
jgi:pimeloyl-ACP methyl ester carboxylesterase